MNHLGETYCHSSGDGCGGKIKSIFLVKDRNVKGRSKGGGYISEDGGRHVQLDWQSFWGQKSQFSGSLDCFYEVVSIQWAVQGDSPGEQHVSIYLLIVSNREAILERKPWFFDNQLLIRHPWSETLNVVVL